MANMNFSFINVFSPIEIKFYTLFKLNVVSCPIIGQFSLLEDMSNIIFAAQNMHCGKRDIVLDENHATATPPIRSIKFNSWIS